MKNESIEHTPATVAAHHQSAVVGGVRTIYLPALCAVFCRFFRGNGHPPNMKLALYSVLFVQRGCAPSAVVGGVRTIYLPALCAVFFCRFFRGNGHPPIMKLALYSVLFVPWYERWHVYTVA